MQRFHEQHGSIESGLGIGTAIEFKNDGATPMRYNKDIKPLVGLGLMYERTLYNYWIIYPSNHFILG